jgi:two-component system, NarL family, sensor histidine kinase DesK
LASGGAVREGVTNVLRHSEARTCTITATRHDGTLRVEILNDRAHPASGSGHGLAERGRELAASVTAGPTPDGGFRLRIDIPGEAPPSGS